ncbi:DUF475 domain-containing protein [Erythrobacter sp. LQ02-29]|uniref:DUF475 domain-containing protein n=1 Tax=Erythrobacter sp. LQ02-29 TaxID=2920384 RepID=UPI001F4E5D7B|nr:DUF475 domain-containing protein [Erythrobacter sp. LQ02-29]MCP9223368.1 DUF475 domain-containing protein [Erythrobacter sp. LQ02-29]
MSGFIRFYGFSIVFTLVCLALGGWYGWESTGSVPGVLGLLWIIAVLSVLEISLSFDNAVVNATVLRNMDEIWQRRFLTWGMLIAVFGMRIAFPLAIVAIAAGIGPVEAVRLSLAHPQDYERIVASAHVGIAGFGGAFLTLVGSRFFFDKNKDVHWIRLVEQRLASVSRVPAIEVAFVLLLLVGISTLIPDEESLTFLMAGIFGIVAFVAVEGISAWLEHREERQQRLGKAVKSGLGGFLYLQVLDSSFSFDGVIGAFALSNNMIVIALGLSIGAMFVRSMTIHLVQRGTLAEYRFLEHGAFWAIIALGIIMLLSARFAIPEAITGLIGAVLIGLSLLWSVRFNRREAAAAI